MRSLPFLIAACLLMYSCNDFHPRNVFKEKNPYKRYVNALKNAEIDRTLMARLWLNAGERALRDSISIPLPYSESGYFKAVEPDARSYTFIAREGQVLTVNGSLNSGTNAKVFLDLFARRNRQWLSVAHADSTLTLSFEFSRGDTCLLRIQPELLVNAYYTIAISMTPVLINPVAGASNRSIGSFYGASRDGGKRAHEGIDIFAKKGTPVIAPTDGYVSRVGTSKLGGKVVWLQDTKRGHSYYFAHLDSQAVRCGVRVRQGQLLGTVGNTGNARNTPAHLHFGIYQRRSKDPIDYVRTLEAVAEALPWDTTLTQPDFKVAGRLANLRCGMLG
jgi:peptidoglycan LD-endopeptidase LytH